jgi:hypothetical protein
LYDLATGVIICPTVHVHNDGCDAIYSIRLASLTQADAFGEASNPE